LPQDGNLALVEWQTFKLPGTSANDHYRRSGTPAQTALVIGAGHEHRGCRGRLLTPEHKGFLSLPIVDVAGYPRGLVSRSALHDIFMQGFGRDLRGHHPVQEVVSPAPLTVSLDTGLEEAAKQITGQLQYPITEGFILVEAQGQYRGLGTGSHAPGADTARGA